jgi:hypothetical protein
MAYEVNKFNGVFLTSVADGTIDTTTDLRLVGKNYAGYGEVQNENFVHLLESFANTTAPPKSVTGQVWFDTSTKKLKFYDGSRFKVAGGAEASASAPSGLAAGDFWWDTGAKQLYTYNGTAFTLIGPIASPDLGTSTISPAVVYGTVSTAEGPHTILKVISDSKTIAIVSKTAFTLDNSKNAIDDFTVIKKGVTLAKSQTGVSTDDFTFWGTASNATKLGGFTADQYIKTGESSFTSEVSFKDPGFQVGDGNDLRINVEGGNNVIIENRLGNDITFRITVTETTDERDIALITKTGLMPGVSNAYTLGSPITTAYPQGLRWSNVYATTFTGSLVGAVTGDTTGSHKGNVLANDNSVIINAATKQIGFAGANIVGTLTGSITGSAATAATAQLLNGVESSAAAQLIDPDTGLPILVATVAIRSSNGNLVANQFVGTADKVDRTFIDRTDARSDPAWADGTVSTQYRTARLTATSYSIAARDISGDITANVFKGTATAARYADLAEKYIADQEYETGTVVMIGGEKEVTAADVNTRAIGVVSANPAYMMNSELQGGTYIALKGRVPCKVYGSVRKGDRLVAGPRGAAIAAHGNYANVFAVALESTGSDSISVIEALVL